MDLPTFYLYRDNWKLWRALGHFENGSWVVPISFMDAHRLPKAMLDTFLILDSAFGRVLNVVMKRRTEQRTEADKVLNSDAP